MSKENTASTGIGLGGLLFIVFLILKLAEIGQVSDWSWWWVTSPLWLPVALVLGMFGIVFIFLGLVKIFEE